METATIHAQPIVYIFNSIKQKLMHKRRSCYPACAKHKRRHVIKTHSNLLSGPGTQGTLAQIREEYWIPKGRVEVRSFYLDVQRVEGLLF